MDRYSLHSDIAFTRIRSAGGSSYLEEDEIISAENLNNFFDFRECFASVEEAAHYARDPTNYVLLAPLRNLLSHYTYLSKQHVKQIARLHKVFFPNITKDELLAHLLRHQCNSICQRVVYVFKSRSKRQTRYIPGQIISEVGVIPSAQKAMEPAARESYVSSEETLMDECDVPVGSDAAMNDQAFNHLEKVSDDLKLSIIRDWQEELAPDNIRTVVCAVCSTRERKARSVMVHGTSFDLKLLRNDELPTGLHPNSYNFDVYDRAILNPKGLLNLTEVGDMIMCRACYTSLRSGNMPKFALSNWLYYGRENLPDEIREALSEASMFERMLISRARCNSICCKFKVADEDGNRSALAGFRKGIRGNVMVAPLDALRLHKVLPPKIELKDTMAAVIVGNKMPSKHTISKLGPVLVRKSRIQLLLSFLLTYNPHYRPGDDLTFSQSNLDAIHDNADGPEVPKTVIITHIDSSEGTENINADYTPRNEDELIESDRLGELVMENVGYTDGDHSSNAYNAMKLLALDRCLTGKPFVISGTGNRPVPDFNNPSILTWLFPHLDPWGIGGFHEPRRRIKISMEEQLRHLLNIDDRSFETDAEFAFVFYNTLRRAEVSQNVRFRVPMKEQKRIVEELKTIDPSELRRLSTVMEQDHLFKAVNSEQIRILKILRSVTMTTRSLPGSDGYKWNMRRQIRAIINAKGAPTLFITLNPADVDNPIVKLFGGEDIDVDDLFNGNLQEMDAWRRKVYAARNPAASAKFFDLMVQTFIKVILKHGTGRRGLYGVCEAYFGAVEAQGKGTLHIHMLIWLRGHPSPEVLRERLMTSDQHKIAFTEWLESVIMNQFPTISERAEDDPSRLKRIRYHERGEPHPGAILGLLAKPGMYGTDDQFWLQYKEHLTRLLHEYNWHIHTATCFKYLKQGEEGLDSNCRMRMDGQLHPVTTVDMDTGRVELKRLHPWISSYTDVVTFLMQCNMNVQFIGSGHEAKAFIYYVTDYITKASLPVHAGLAALWYAARKIYEYNENPSEAPDSYFTKALTKFVNAIMGRQEISHQQVMSYLVGGGDHYTSEMFQNVYLGAFIKYIADEEKKTVQDVNLIDEAAEPDMDFPAEETVSLTIEKEDIGVNNQVWDYRYRPQSEPYGSMCLYDFVAKTSKRKMKKKDTLADSSDSFSSWDHPQRGTHRLAKRNVEVLPVIIGPSLPNRRASEEAREFWSKQIMILFKPWRSLSELKNPGRTWRAQYDADEEGGILGGHQDIIANMQLLTECADARFSKTDISSINTGQEPEQDRETEINQSARTDIDAADEEAQGIRDTQQWREQYCSDVFGTFEVDPEDLEGTGTSQGHKVPVQLQDELGKQVVDALQVCLRPEDVHRSHSHVSDASAERYYRDVHGDEVNVHCAIMAKKRKRQINTEDEGDDRESKRISTQSNHPFVTIDTLPLNFEGERTKCQRTMNEIVSEMNLGTKPEQLEAFKTVADHVATRESEQLVLLVSGVGGTGKSHVIKSIVKFFERLGRRGTLLIGAPTGSAAVLIGGATLHSLILEHASERGKKNVSKLAAIWKGVKYLIIDEVSMLGAKFLNNLSESLRQAKGDDIVNRDKIFGGINVIFMGDLCQLKPPRQVALYGRPTAKTKSNKATSKDEIRTMNGIVIWKQVTKVIELVKNCRHSGDPRFSDFLSRLRVGKCIGLSTNATSMDDYQYLQSRLLTNIYRQNPQELESFKDAPFIVGTKKLRDLLNAEIISSRAARANKEVHIYYSKDFCKRQVVSGGSAEYLWALQSSFVRDSLGRLPMFEGMKVMVTENIAFDSKVVNGSEGTIRKILYDVDDEGRRYATAAYVHIEGIGFKIPGLEEDVVPIFPTRVSISSIDLDMVGLEGSTFSRHQLPLIPAYAFTDFKSQGKTLAKAIVDINTARGQGTYVMLSRVTSLSGIAILRWFPPSCIYTRLPEDLRTELKRLNCAC
ncbi:hypothetical protein CVT26_007829 [Gymnopilus dilepis]|uniref:ATP-dependent DNA helicase n=1 Tax=Gymnopilus dilepis TaxID=231916 RepID=A0A409WEU1_9AGAR|nr:hypothetical protein CVT26_007829 [Gymnopilus dilepis]